MENYRCLPNHKAKKNTVVKPVNTLRAHSFKNMIVCICKCYLLLKFEGIKLYLNDSFVSSLLVNSFT